MSTTETAARRFKGLESWPTEEIVDAMLEGQLAAIAAIHATRPQLARAIDAAAARIVDGGRLIYVGAGTSGRIGALDAAELSPTFGFPRKRAISIMAGGPRAYAEAVEGAEDNKKAALAELEQIGLSPRDVVIGIAASGRTPFVLSALSHGRVRDALTIAVTNNPNAQVSDIAEITLVAATGAEVLAGSTRMKAGTAQKALLTCLSTGIFIRLGHVFQGRMVEMRPTNAKLQKRAIEMVADLTDCSQDEAARTLEASGGNIKCAVLMVLLDISAEEASRRLSQNDNRLHIALN
ncbi:MAG: N-acetylmuramic acid 6-phosphate etherase [Pseudorhodobacter sp.]